MGEETCLLSSLILYTVYVICTTGLQLPTCNLIITQHLFSPFSIRLIAHSVSNCTVERKEGCVSALTM